MEKIAFPWITVDLTHRCNMKCAHCLRGKADKENLNLEKADHFFSQIAWTTLLHLTGGEPTLAIKELEGLVRILEKHQVVFNSVCIGTNAKIVPDAFLDVLKDLYLLSVPSEKEANRVFISIDPYHAPIPQENLNKLHRLKKYQWQVDISKKDADNIYQLGRAKEIAKKKMDRRQIGNLGGMSKFIPGLFDRYSVSDKVLHHTSCQFAEFPIELSVDGKLYPMADMSWEEQKNSPYLLEIDSSFGVSSLRQAISTWHHEEKWREVNKVLGE